MTDARKPPGSNPEDEPELLGFARITLGSLDRPATIDERLYALAIREINRPEWRKAPEPVKRAFVALYGRAKPPKKLNGWAEHTAVKFAIALSGPKEARK